MRRSSALFALVALTASTAILAGTASATPATAPASAPGTATAPASLPNGPFGTDVPAQGLGLLVAWAPSPPEEAVTGYDVSVTPAGDGVAPPAGCAGPFTASAPATDSAAIVSGLCAGLAYQASVRATSAVGAGAYGLSSNPTVPLTAQVPGAPLIETTFGRDGSLLVTWSAPATDGGAPVTGYVLTATPTAGGVPVTSTPAPADRSATVTGLTNGVAYDLSLTASNRVGSSAAGVGSGTPAAVKVPGGPRDITAVPDGSGALVVAWVVPEDDGGDAVSGFTVTAQQVVSSSTSPDGYAPAYGSTPQTVTASGTATSVTVPSSMLQPQNALYRVTVAAANTVGLGAAIAAEAPASPVAQLTSGTVVLSPSTMAAAASDVDGVLTWPAPAPAQVTGLTAGQVILAGAGGVAPAGLLRRISSITVGVDGSYAVATGAAGLDEAFSSLALAASSDPFSQTSLPASSVASPSSSFSFSPSVPGVRVLTAPRTAGSPSTGSSSGGPLFTFSRKITLAFDRKADKTGFKVQPFLKGQVTFEPTITLDAAITKDVVGVPDGVSVRATGVVKAKEQMTLGLTSKDGLRSSSGDKFELARFKGAPIDIQVGFLPVIVVPQFSVVVDVNGTIGVTVTAEQRVGGSVSWSSHDATHLNFKNLSDMRVTSGGYVPRLSVVGTAKVELQTEVAADLYDAAGPDLLAYAGVSIAGTATPAPGKGYLSLTPLLGLRAEFEVKRFAFIKGTKLSRTIAQYPFPTYEFFKTPAPLLDISPGPVTVPPGAQVTFSSTRSDGDNSHPVSWSLEDAAGDSVTDRGVFTAAGPDGRAVTLVAKDSSGSEGAASVTIGTAPYDAPQALTATAHTADTDADVSWTPPDNTGGTPLTGYTLVGSGVPTQSVPAGTTRVTLHKLARDRTYVLRVYARNSAGRTSPPANTDLHTTPLGVAVSLASARNPSVRSDGVDFAVSVNPAGGTVSPTGTVDLLEGNTLLASAALTDGLAHFTPSLAPGSHVLTARYAGDGTFGSATSDPLTQRVNQVRIVDLGTLPGIASSAAIGFSDSIVAGNAGAGVGGCCIDHPSHGWVYYRSAPSGGLHDLGNLGTSATFVRAVSGNIVVGFSSGHAFAYDAGAASPAMIDLGPGEAWAVSGNNVVGQDYTTRKLAAWNLATSPPSKRALPDFGNEPDITGISGNIVAGYAFLLGPRPSNCSNKHAIAYDLGETAPQIKDLGTLGGCDSEATGVSGNRIVGFTNNGYYEPTKAFVYDLGAASPHMQDLGSVGGVNSRAEAIGGATAVGETGDGVFAVDLDAVDPAMQVLNNSYGSYDAIATDGRFVVGTGPSEGYSYDLASPSAAVQDLGTLGGTRSRPYAVSGGVVVGGAGTADGQVHAVLWDLNTVTTLVTSVNPVTVKAATTLTARVTTVRDPLPGTGAVTFYDGATAVGTAPLTNGVAALTTSALTPGAHALKAVYAPDSPLASSTSTVLRQQVNYTDVPASHQFAADIYWLTDHKITTGFADGSFRPSVAVTRQAMAPFVYRTLGSPAFTSPADPSFADVATSHPFYKEIEWMRSTGISTGTPQPAGKPLFKPTDAVARQAMAAFLYRAAGKPAFTPPADPSFAEVPTTHPFYKEIEWMKATGISTGTPQPTGKPLFKPADPVARQAAAAFLHRFATRPGA